jgi:glycosyltransferase involved in cell wall biosynthesis
LLSVIIPALEVDVELRRCIDSVRIACGESASYEIVLVTPKAIVGEAAHWFPGAKVCPERRRGIYAAMNDGASASSGRYLYFLGKDDILLPTIGRVLEVLAIASPDLVSCDVYWGARGRISGNPGRLRLLVGNLCHQGLVYRRELFFRDGPFLRAMRIQADHYLNIRVLWNHARARVVYLRFPLVWFSAGGSSSRQVDPVFWRLYPVILRRHVGRWAAVAVCIYRALRGKRAA